MRARADAGTFVLLALLFTALVLSGILTFEAVAAERAHRAAVRKAIQDDASIVADDLVRRTVFEFSMFVSLPLRRVLAGELVDHNMLPTAEALRHDPRVKDIVPLVGEIYLVDFRSGRVEPPQPEPLQSWLLTRLPGIAREQQKKGDETVVRPHLPGGPDIVIYGPVQYDKGRIFAFNVPERSVGILAARAFARRSAFPGLMGSGRVTNRDVFIRMSRDGQELFRTRGRFEPASGTVMAVPANYGMATGGMQVESSIAPRAVPALIAGGLPPTRIPLLLVMLATSAGVLIAAWLLLRRERELANLRSDFVSGVSHELRTPLTQIRMFSETLLLDRVRSTDERQRSLHIINEEAQRLTNLVDNVLFLSRDPRHAVPPAATCDIEELVADAIDAFAPLAMRRDAVIMADTPPRLTARVDGEAWKQVLTNLLDNAVKYGPEGQTVRVRVSKSGGRIRMAVEDEGPGIPEAERESVWNRFYRLARDRGTHKAGSGIGLSIVQEVMKRHGGRCWVEAAPGGGARFIVEAPVDEPPAAPSRRDGRR